MKKSIVAFFIITFLIALAIYHFWEPKKITEDIELERESLKKIFPQGTHFSAKMGDPPIYEVYKEGEIVGVGFSSMDVVPDEGGYGGPINIIVGIDKKGVIKGVDILSHSETPLYMDTLLRSNFLQQFKGRKVQDTFSLGFGKRREKELDSVTRATPAKELDGVTRATITAEAIARIVKKASQKVASKKLGIEVAQVETKPYFSKLDESVLIILIIVATIGIITRINLLRILTLIVAVVFLGFAKATPLSVVNITSFLSLKIPILKYNIFWYSLILGIFVLTLILGRVYCGWLCPFGALQEFTSKLKKKKLNPPFSLENNAKNIKFILLWITVVGALLLRNLNVTSFEPYSTLFTFSGSLLMWAFVTLTLGISIWDSRFWCKYLCPSGAFLGIVSCKSPFRLKTKDVPCKECNLCIKTCPVKAIHKDDKEAIKINSIECIQCNLCASVCTSNHFYRRLLKRNQKSE